jgi:hypothetical protein
VGRSCQGELAGSFHERGLFLPIDGQLSSALQEVGGKGRHARAISSVASLARRTRGFVYALPRSARSYAFLFVARDARIMDELVDRFVDLPAAGEGALVEISR